MVKRKIAVCAMNIKNVAIFAQSEGIVSLSVTNNSYVPALSETQSNPVNNGWSQATEERYGKYLL